MLNHHDYRGSEIASAASRRFLASISATLADLKSLLIDSPRPIEAGTGAQIAQMLRAMRESAGTFDFQAIARKAADIEAYLLSSEAYGPSGSLRSFVLGSRIEDLSQIITDAMEED